MAEAIIRLSGLTIHPNAHSQKQVTKSLKAIKNPTTTTTITTLTNSITFPREAREPSQLSMGREEQTKDGSKKYPKGSSHSISLDGEDFNKVRRSSGSSSSWGAGLMRARNDKEKQSEANLHAQDSQVADEASRRLEQHGGRSGDLVTKSSSHSSNYHHQKPSLSSSSRQDQSFRDQSGSSSSHYKNEGPAVNQHLTVRRGLTITVVPPHSTKRQDEPRESLKASSSSRGSSSTASKGVDRREHRPSGPLSGIANDQAKAEEKVEVIKVSGVSMPPVSPPSQRPASKAPKSI